MKLGLADSVFFKAIDTFLQDASFEASECRKTGRLDDARATARRLMALARQAVREYPDSAHSYGVLCEAYRQNKYNGIKNSDNKPFETAAQTIEAAQRVLALRPEGSDACDWLAISVGPLSPFGSSSTAATYDRDREAGAIALISALRERCSKFGLAEALIPETMRIILRDAHFEAAEMRRLGRLDDAHATVARIMVIARRLVREYPNSACSYRVLCDAYKQNAQDGIKIRDDKLFETPAQAIEAAQRALALRPEGSDACDWLAISVEPISPFRSSSAAAMYDRDREAGAISLIGALRERCSKFGLADSLIPETMRIILDDALLEAMEMRRLDRLDDARATVARLMGIARRLVREYPASAYSYRALSDAHNQVKKNAFATGDDQLVEESLVQAIEAAQQALALGPDRIETRPYLERLTKLLASIKADRKAAGSTVQSQQGIATAPASR